MEWLKGIIGNIEFDEENKGAADEIVKAIKTEMAKHMVPKSEFNSKNDALKELQTKYDADITDRDNQLSELSKQAGISDELKAKLTEYEQNNASTKAEYEQKIADMQKQQLNDKKMFNLKQELSKLNPKQGFEDLILKDIDLEKLTVDGEKIIGTNDIIENIKSNYSWALGETKLVGAEPTNEGQVVTGNVDTSKMSDTEYFEYRKKQK